MEARRQAGMEHLDLACGEPIAWEVRLPRCVSRERTGADVARLRAALEADPAAGRVRVAVERGKRVDAIFRFIVQARSHTEALQACLDVQKRTIDEAPYPIDELPDSVVGAFAIYTNWDPMKDIRPADG